MCEIEISNALEGERLLIETLNKKKSLSSTRMSNSCNIFHIIFTIKLLSKEEQYFRFYDLRGPERV